MKHHLLERYAGMKSPIHSQDGAVKLVFVLISIITITLLKGFWGLIIFTPIFLVATIVSTVPIFYILKRALVVLPFLLFVVIFSPIPPLGKLALILRSILCASYMVLLVTTTGFNNIVVALRRLRVPPMIVMIISFMMRYLFIVANELSRMVRSYTSRSFGKNSFYKIRGLACLTGSLFLKSYSRGERVYFAMLSRGFKEGVEH